MINTVSFRGLFLCWKQGCLWGVSGSWEGRNSPRRPALLTSFPGAATALLLSSPVRGQVFALIEGLFSQRKSTKILKAVCLSSAPGVLDFHWVNCNLFSLCFPPPLFFFPQRLSLLNLNNKNHRTNLPVSEKNCRVYKISTFTINHLWLHKLKWALLLVVTLVKQSFYYS